MAKIKFADEIENITTRKEFPLSKAQDVLKDEVVAVLGYGVQGPAQSLNMRDNGVNVIVGQRKSDKPNSSWQRAINDGWVPGKTLFDIETAAEKGTIVMMLTSDASIKPVFKQIRKHLTPGKALYFSHGFGWQYRDLTGVEAPEGVDVIMVAPKGSGTSVRRNFLEGVGINSSYAVAVDATGRALDRTLALGIAVGSGYLFPTTFQREVTSDLVGERGTLMGCLQGILNAQYTVLRKHGHSPSEAFNETVEELTQSLIRLVDEKGMDWMYSNCSATAQHGALKWAPEFEKATKPVFEKLYKSVADMTEAKAVVRDCGRKDYKERLEAKLAKIRDSEMWRAGQAVRSLRPQQRHRRIAAGGRPAQLLQRDPLQRRQRQPDGAPVGEHRHRPPVVGRRDLPHRGQHAGLDCLGRLCALHVPQVQPAVKVLQLLRVPPGDLAPGLLLPDAHADLPQIPPPVQGQPLGPVNGAGGGAGAVEVTGVHRIYGNFRKAALQRPDLLPAQVRQDAVVLSLGDAVQVSLRLCVADQIDRGHGSSLGPGPFSWFFSLYRV